MEVSLSFLFQRVSDEKNTNRSESLFADYSPSFQMFDDYLNAARIKAGKPTHKMFNLTGELAPSVGEVLKASA